MNRAGSLLKDKKNRLLNFSKRPALNLVAPDLMGSVSNLPIKSCNKKFWPGYLTSNVCKCALVVLG